VGAVAIGCQVRSRNHRAKAQGPPGGDEQEDASALEEPRRGFARPGQARRPPGTASDKCRTSATQRRRNDVEAKRSGGKCQGASAKGQVPEDRCHPTTWKALTARGAAPWNSLLAERTVASKRPLSLRLGRRFKLQRHRSHEARGRFGAPLSPCDQCAAGVGEGILSTCRGLPNLSPIRPENYELEPTGSSL
jgi:hypothetical protein